MLERRQPAAKEAIKLLVVEDNPSDYHLVKEMLGFSHIGDFSIHHAVRLSDAIREIKDDDYDAVLLDLNLPDSRSYETFSTIHRECPNIPVIIMTGSTDENVALRAVNEGAQDYLFKDDINERNLGHSIVFGIRRKSIEKQVGEEKRKAELYIDLLTHDINNLNAAAMGYLQLIQGKVEADGKLRDYASKSIDALADSSELIDSVVKLQRSRAPDLEKKGIDLKEIISQVVDSTPRPPGRTVDIHIEAEGAPKALGSDLLRDVFTNIVNNAIKHSRGDIRIEIRVDRVERRGKPFQRVIVEDNGPGVPDETKEKIFYRAQRGRTGAVGRGIGLFLVKQLVDADGGDVWVEDRVPGDRAKGARFVVLLPAAELC